MQSTCRGQMFSSTSKHAARGYRAAAQSHLEISNFFRNYTRSRTADHVSNNCIRLQYRSLHQQVSAPTDVIDRFKRTISFPAASCEISELVERVDGEVVLHGYLGPRNAVSKKLCFAPLLSQGLKHSVQIVSSTQDASELTQKAHQTLLNISPNSPVAVTAKLRPRKVLSTKDVGEVKKIKNKELDLIAIQPLNSFPKEVTIMEDTILPPEKRHLQLRYGTQVRQALHFRSDVARKCRNLLCERGFFEIETPLLFKSTPEGAREFMVPTRRKGFAYALPQSPQQYKQILMASGIPKYFQLARCFRDEDLRADRQPEFTQLDLEMAFATGEDVMALTEAIINDIWITCLDIDLQPSFPRLTYQEAMARYGSDKPDTRLSAIITRLDYLLPVDLISKISTLTMPVVEGFRLRLGEKGTSPTDVRKFVGEFLDSTSGQAFFANPHGGPGIFIFDSSQPLRGLQSLGFEASEAVEHIFGMDDGDLLVLQARPDAPFTGGSTMLGNLRLALSNQAVKEGLLPTPSGFEPLWVTDFPLFSPSSVDEPGQGGHAGLAATHHPFTSPKTEEDVSMLVTDPSQVVGDHYDLVINGCELGGGSRRIHDADMQRFVMEKVLRMPPEGVAEFSHLLEALSSGCPPHAGIALGFDRLITIMLGLDSVRDVIAFPKHGRGDDLFVKSPAAISEERLATYHLKMR